MCLAVRDGSPEGVRERGWASKETRGRMGEKWERHPWWRKSLERWAGEVLRPLLTPQDGYLKGLTFRSQQRKASADSLSFRPALT